MTVRRPVRYVSSLISCTVNEESHYTTTLWPFSLAKDEEDITTSMCGYVNIKRVKASSNITHRSGLESLVTWFSGSGSWLVMIIFRK